MKGYDALEQLALNLRSNWNHKADLIWRTLDRELWDMTHNPWAVLQAASRESIEMVLADPKLNFLVDEFIKHREGQEQKFSWFQKNHAGSSLSCVAYFSMEFMLSEALPIYSGGLGNVAGDQLKAADDLGVPVVGIGLLYAQGYFRQFIDQNGEQQELYPYNDPGQLPIKPKRLANGKWLRLKIELPGWPLWLRVWEVIVGTRVLYLLDSNDIANFPAHRGITSELYGGDTEIRLKQEMVLGIGGWRLLNALGIDPEICHMNEGHAAFAVLERAYCFMQKMNQPFDVAFAATRIGNLFTTHTAVPAGFDRFPLSLIRKYLETYAQEKLHIPIERLLALGQAHLYDDFNMAYLAIRGSGFTNGVSQLHSAVSRRLFEDLFPRFPVGEVPIGCVTNGVHVPSWDSAISDNFWTEFCGKERWLETTEQLDCKIRMVSDAKIWQLRNESRKCLVDYASSRLVRDLQARGVSEEEINQARSCLDPNLLTLGFARRFAEYKRPDLLLFDQSRFLKIFMNQDRPVQLILAGKAHPADAKGHELIKKWMKFIAMHRAQIRVIFLSDYDVILTEHLVQGVDVWINTPRRPWEASGTSGMKVLVNGGLNLSELDGWWAEAYAPDVGWALGDRREHDSDLNWDRREASVLYDLLENEVIPEFYKRNEQGVPVGWIKKIRESMARLTPYFSSNRVVREYTEKFYLPAAANYRKRVENHCDLAKKIVNWQKDLESHWNQIKFGALNIKTDRNQHRFEIHVYLDGLDRTAVQVDLYSDRWKKEMKYQGPVSNAPNWHIYIGEAPAEHPPIYFTPRVLPYFPDLAIPLESAHVLWQK